MAFQVTALRLLQQVKSFPTDSIERQCSSFVEQSVRLSNRSVNMASRTTYELAFAASATSTPSQLGRYKNAAVSCDGAQCSNVAW